MEEVKEPPSEIFEGGCLIFTLPGVGQKHVELTPELL